MKSGRSSVNSFSMKFSVAFLTRGLILALLPLVAWTQLGLFGRGDKEEGKEKARQEVRQMREEVLAMLYEKDPRARGLIEKAEGYAVFSNVGVNIIFGSLAGGSGIVTDRKDGKETFMKMGSAGVGLGIGIKDFRAVFVFHDRSKMESFLKHGWDFSGQADAAAKSDEKGGSAEAAGTLMDGITLYQLTKNGLAIQATLQGTKYWKDGDLN